MKTGYFILIQGTIAYLPTIEIKVDPPGIGGGHLLFLEGKYKMPNFKKGHFYERNSTLSEINFYTIST
jgi:hypothetical protein